MDSENELNKREQILRREWENDVRSRTVAKLLSMLHHPEKYTPESLAFVKEIIIEKMQEETSHTARRYAKMATRDLFLATLRKMGCRYDIEEDGMICFMYLGEYFYAKVHNDNPYIAIHDYCWESVNLDDIDEVSWVRRAVNEANIESFATTYCYVDEAQKELRVSTRCCFIFVPQLEGLENYLSTQLTDFFNAHRTFEVARERLRKEEK